MSTQMESQQPMPPESGEPGGETPVAPEEPSRQGGFESGSVFGATGDGSDNEPPPWTPPPAG